MLSTLDIKNYRSCRDTTVSFNPDLTVLIGPNGCGKTTIMNAVLLLRRLLFDDVRYRTEEATADESSIGVWFRVPPGRVKLDAEISLYADSDNSDVVIASSQKWYVRDFTGTAKRLKTPLALFNWIDGDGSFVSANIRRHVRLNPAGIDIPSAFINPAKKILNYISGMRYYSASQFTDPSRCPVSIEVSTGRQSRLAYNQPRGHAKFVRDLYDAWKGEEETDGYKEFLSVVGRNGIGLIDDIRFEEVKISSVDVTVRTGGRVGQQKREKLLVVPQFKIGKNTLSPSQLSEGTFKTLVLLFYIMTHQSTALLIEEPEVCIHHGLLDTIIELIVDYSKSKQIVVSTHSDYFLDKVSPESVVSVRSSPDTGTTASDLTNTMSPDELSALRHYLATEGTLGEYWRHGSIE